MADDNGNVKLIATVLLVVAALAMAYYFAFIRPSEEPVLKTGSQINSQTFASLLSDSHALYIVMDVRGVKDDAVRRNILQCGTDFAGSMGLADKEKTFYSLDSSLGCIGATGNYSVKYCFDQMNSGLTIMVHEGNESRFYTNAMVVGINESYTVGGCAISRVG